MVELYQQERLQPSLLDRLTDESALDSEATSGTSDPHAKPKDSIDRFVISSSKLRQYIKRDLGWLLNTSNLENVVDLADYPQTARSVLNYGMPDLAGITSRGADSEELERRLHQAIVEYEPRILKNTLRLKAIKSGEMSFNAIIIEIECDIWGQPAPEHLYLNTTVDLDTGQIEFVDRRGS